MVRQTNIIERVKEKYFVYGRQEPEKEEGGEKAQDKLYTLKMQS